MASKSKAVGKTPSAAALRKDIRTLGRREASAKHEAATDRNASSRKHAEARSRSIAKRIRSDKHELAEDASKKKSGGKKRGWSPDETVQCCSARAVAESLRLATGVRVADGDVLALYWRTATDADAGQAILDALDAAWWQLGIAHHAEPRDLLARRDGHRLDLSMLAAGLDPDRTGVAHGANVNPFPARVKQLGRGHALILGLDLPLAEPHAVAVGPDGTWWSWGEPFDPAEWPGLVIDECWAVRWN